MSRGAAVKIPFRTCEVSGDTAPSDRARARSESAARRGGAALQAARPRRAPN